MATAMFAGEILGVTTLECWSLSLRTLACSPHTDCTITVKGSDSIPLPRRVVAGRTFTTHVGYYDKTQENLGNILVQGGKGGDALARGFMCPQGGYACELTMRQGGPWPDSRNSQSPSRSFGMYAAQIFLYDLPKADWKWKVNLVALTDYPGTPFGRTANKNKFGTDG